VFALPDLRHSIREHSQRELLRAAPWSGPGQRHHSAPRIQLARNRLSVL